MYLLHSNLLLSSKDLSALICILFQAKCNAYSLFGKKMNHERMKNSNDFVISIKKEIIRGVGVSL